MKCNTYPSALCAILMCFAFPLDCQGETPVDDRSDVYIIGVLGPANIPKDGDSDPCTKPGRVRVIVGQTDKPVTIVLSNSLCTKWIIKRDRGNNLVRIIPANLVEQPNFGLEFTSYPGGPDSSGPEILQIGGPIGIYPYQRGPLFSSNDLRCSENPPDLDCKSRLSLLKDELKSRYGLKRFKAFSGTAYGRVFRIGR